MRLPEEKREEIDKLIRDIAEHAHVGLLEDGDEEFFACSQSLAMGIARGMLALGYRKDWTELQATVDRLFKR
jgi:hypothetical protein